MPEEPNVDPNPADCPELERLWNAYREVGEDSLAGLRPRAQEHRVLASVWMHQVGCPRCREKLESGESGMSVEAAMEAVRELNRRC